MSTLKLSRMGLTDGIILIVFLSISRFFLITSTEAIKLSAGLAWYLYLISTLVTLIIGLALINILKNFEGDLLAMTERLLGKSWFYIIGIYYALLFLSNCTVLTRKFSENIAQVGFRDIDIIVVIFLYVLIMSISTYFGIEVLARGAYLLIPFIIFLTAFILVLIIPLFNVHNLAPWQGTGIGNVTLYGMASAGANSGVIIIAILAPSFQDFITKAKSVFYGSIIGGLYKMTCITTILLAIGVERSKEMLIPFYELASLAYFDKSFQRFEDLTVFLWIFVGLISIGVSAWVTLYLVARMLKLSDIKPLIPLLSIIVFSTATFAENALSIIDFDLGFLKIYHGLSMYVFPIILLFMFYKQKLKLLFKKNSAV
ncbi:spore germination protein [Selenomonadales bacterium OttesenSCG-928-I06]|nr:spore germination protein [Selenomonadales bacterium OttesenSCG-928-I06]